MILNIVGQSKIEAIRRLIDQKSYVATAVEFTGTGRVRSFPASKLGRFVIPTSDFYQVATRPGAYIAKNALIGENNVSFDYLPNFDRSVSFNFYTTIITAPTVQNNGAYFDTSLKLNLNKNDVAIFESYSIELDGDYGPGTRQMAFFSSLPIVIGDQFLLSDNAGNTHRSVVKNAVKTLNENQWNVTLDNVIPFSLIDGSEVFVEASSVQYWESIPIDMGPCSLQLPITTHRTFSETEELAISYVRLKNGSLETESFYISETTLQIPNVNISSSAWLSSVVLEGSVDYQNGCSQFIPKFGGEFYAKLSFIDALDGNRIQSWQFKLNCLDKGRVSIKVNDTTQAYDVKKGLQTVLFNVPNEKISFIDFMCDVPISFGGITCTNGISNIDVSIHLFNPLTMNSHVIGRPGLIELLPSPTISWAVEGKSGVDRGYKLKPAKPRVQTEPTQIVSIKKNQNIFLTPVVAQVLNGATLDFTVSFTDSEYYESFTVELIGTDSTDGGNNAVPFASTASTAGTTITLTAGNAGETAKLKVTSEKTGKVAISDIYVIELFA